MLMYVWCVQTSTPDTMFVMREYKEINKIKILNINKVDVLMSPLLGLLTKAKHQTTHIFKK